MLDFAIVAVALLAVLAVILLIAALAKPDRLGRLVPWLGRPTTSRKAVASVFGLILAMLVIAEGGLLAIPNYRVSLPDGDRVVAGEATGVKIGIENASMVARSYSAAYLLDGIKQSDVVVRVSGRHTEELSVPLPRDLTPGAHTVVVGDDGFRLTALKPAAFSVTALDTDAKIAKTGQRVVISAAVVNTGEAPGEFDGELFVNGRRHDAQPITIEPGQQESLSYTFSGRSQRKNHLRLGDATRALVVVNPMHYGNGHYLRRIASGGYGILKVKNGNRVDGVVVLTRSSARKVPVIACYICAHRSFTINGIPDGTYRIYYALGRDWNTYTDGFLTGTERVFLSPTKYTTSRWTTSWNDSAYRYTQGHIRGSGWRITLNPVPGGTAVTSNVAENDFPRVH